MGEIRGDRRFHSRHLPDEGTTVINITSPDLPDGGLALAHTRSYPREFLTTDTNEPLLRQLAEIGGGKFSPAPSEVFARAATRNDRRRDITDWLLIAALALMPVDIWLRRRTWK